ncbi:winged helix-turn-helix domain-containing protein [Nitrosovibrio sp. Nv6]|uniref:winged helix-turn-helix domain-containing protein n=1 Tax=Nitrosovibrio sp. Nv6 TaxID=1855340 RepID=UPI000B2E95D5|nr:winged helix-turn-helix domain-containing protein [Nitrosovibrio sp. Nv6]
MIPDYQMLMRPILECVSSGEGAINDVVEKLADRFKLTDEERAELLPSGKQTRFTNRVNWAKSYLKQAGLVSITRRGYFEITDKGHVALSDPSTKINNAYLEQFESFSRFQESNKGS